MNRQEWLQSKGKYNSHHKQVQKRLKEWKLENNIQERCVVHHRDDTEECIKYNNEHYELWGFNEDSTFEYGKYVVFMTDSEHAKYHNMGKHLSEETKEKLRLAIKGRHHSEETKIKMRNKASENIKAIKVLYDMYKRNGGNIKWNDSQKALKT